MNTQRWVIFIWHMKFDTLEDTGNCRQSKWLPWVWAAHPDLIYGVKWWASLCLSFVTLHVYVSVCDGCCEQKLLAYPCWCNGDYVFRWWEETPAPLKGWSLSHNLTHNPLYWIGISCAMFATLLFSNNVMQPCGE